MSDTITQFDNYLSPDGPAALVIREHLMPVEGADGVFFPSTFAALMKSSAAGDVAAGFAPLRKLPTPIT